MVPPRIDFPLEASPVPYLILMALGFLIGVFGHIVRSRTVVAVGIGMIFLALIVLPLVVVALRS